jgi:hypothetical protein
VTLDITEDSSDAGSPTRLNAAKDDEKDGHLIVIEENNTIG